MANLSSFLLVLVLCSSYSLAALVANGNQITIEIERGIQPNGIMANALNFNSLSLNSLTFNALSANALTSNALTLNALTYNALSINGMYSGLILGNGQVLEFGTAVDGAMILEFFHYYIQCALPYNDSWSLTINETEHILKGGVGLVPDIKEKNITSSDWRWLSACLLGHVNAFGITVEISVRGMDKVDVTPEELAQYKVYEGAFFGDVSSNTTWFSCQGESKQEAESESTDRVKRVCTDVDANCGMTVTGKCKDVCSTYEDQKGYSDCTAGGVTYVEVMNVFLNKDIQEDSNPSSAFKLALSWLLISAIAALFVL